MNMFRPCTRILLAFVLMPFTCIGVLTIHAQAPFSYELEHPDTTAHLYVFDVEAIGTDLYRLKGSCDDSTGSHIWQLDVDANGVIVANTAIETQSTVRTGERLASKNDVYTWFHDSSLYVMETDSALAPQWVRKISSPPGLFVLSNDVALAKDGQAILLGHDQLVTPSAGWSSSLLVADSNGTATLMRFMENDTYSEPGRAIRETNTNGFLTVTYQRPWFTGGSYPRFLIQRWDSAWNVLWSNSYKFGGHHSLGVVELLNDGGLFIAGYFRVSGLGSAQYAFRMKLDGMGAVSWVHATLEDDPSERVYWIGMTEEPDGSILLGGLQNGPIMMRMDSLGNALDVKHYGQLPINARPDEITLDGSNGDSPVFSGAALFDHRAYMARLDQNLQGGCMGTTIPWSDTTYTVFANPLPITVSYDTLPATDTLHTNVAFPNMIINDLCLSTNLGVISEQEKTLLWPNPASEVLQVTAELNGYTYSIFSAQGTLLQSGSIRSGSIDVHELKSGLYHLHMSNGDDLSTVRFVIE